MRTLRLEENETHMHTPSLREPAGWPSNAGDKVEVAQVCGSVRKRLLTDNWANTLKREIFENRKGRHSCPNSERGGTASIRN
jgi:hypothetical protein